MNISGDRSDDCVDHHQRYAREDSCDVSDEEGIEVPEHDDICEMSDREQSERCQRASYSTAHRDIRARQLVIGRLFDAATRYFDKLVYRFSQASQWVTFCYVVLPTQLIISCVMPLR